MKLIKCYIENFGILHAQNISFSKGLNCCISENGTGKTTLTAFIEAMLYGIGDTRKQSLDENPRKKYSPWQGGRFGGSLTVEVGKRRYVIERSFGQKAADDTFRLLDADSGRESSDYGENIGERLFGIDRDGFLRTVFLSEKNLQGKNENRTISAKLSDLVGVDGDVEGFDSALKLLEERRKFYYKKGNTGEIANVKERINETARRLDNATRLEGEVKAKELRLVQLKSELEKIEAVKNRQKFKLNELNKDKTRGAQEEQYASMLQRLEKNKETLNSELSFFGGVLPTFSEIDSARDKHMEARRLRREAMAELGNEEYVALAEYFKKGTSFVEISEMEQTAKRTLELSNELQLIKSGSDMKSVQMRKIFASGVPTSLDIEKMEKAAKSSSGFLRALFTLLGLLSIAGGVLLGGNTGYALIGVGAIVTLISLITPKKSKKSKQMLAIARQFNGCECSNLGGIVKELKEKLARYEALKSERCELEEALNDEYNEKMLKLCEFLGKFPIENFATTLDAVRAISTKYTRYYTLMNMSESENSIKVKKLETANELSKDVQQFLARFQTVSDDPFTEIRSRLNDYHIVRSNTERLMGECDVFAVKYGVMGKTVSIDPQLEATVDATLREAEGKQSLITEELALLTREIEKERQEAERKEEYEMEKAALEELYRKHTESLDIIQKTAKLLTEACDSITSKYLGKTKEKFLEYSSLISGSTGDYTLNTSFELTKTEGGEAHGIEAYSRGTRDLYALGLRLALVDALYENEAPFIILDDPFIALDDARLEKAKATLKSIGRTKQILYFTCAKSRAIE